MSEFEDQSHLTAPEALGAWVLDKAEEWRQHYDANYDESHQEYYRIWRSRWAEEDKTRESERSKLVAPATQQAVESNVAEIEEATFSNGRIFDLEDEHGDSDSADIQQLRKQLTEDFETARIRSNIGEVLINAAVYGTGIAEINLEQRMTYKPATQDLMDGAMQAVGVNEAMRTIVTMNPVQPHNFLIDPNATCIDDALGCAIDEYVSSHVVEQLQEKGVYRDIYVGTVATDEEVETDRELYDHPEHRVRLLKYYGLVPTEALAAEGVEDLGDEMYTEAIVVIANEGHVLKAIKNPYMCQDRPVVAFAWDVVPSRFWGRGVCEKGYMSQKALDAEMRARIDALGLTTHPMMGVDSTRIPRGATFEVRPGKMFMTAGPPSEVLQPFHFGQVDQITFAQANALQEMVQSATGAVDSAGMAGNINGEATAAGISMSLGAIIKRQKRTLVNFQENFLMPFVRKAAWRYMQFDSENYPVADYKFRVISSLGVIAREYEVGQLTQMLQSMPPDSPATMAILSSVVEHLNVSNREEILAILENPPPANPEAEANARRKEQMEIAVLQSQIDVLQSQAAESQARAAKYAMEAQLMPTETSLKYADTNNDGKMDSDFDQRMQIADLMLRERDMAIKEKQAQDTAAQDAEAELIRQLAGE